MKSLYWISVLGSLDVIVQVIIFFLCIAAVIFGFSYLFTDYDEDRLKYKKRFLVTLSIGLITAVLSLFVPSKQDLYIIYGVGNVIDYIKENPDAQQLPDKTIQVLNKMADDYIQKEK